MRETWQQYRARLIRETEIFIEWGLRNPDKVTRIPMKRMGNGGWPVEVGAWFWNTVLTSRPTDAIKHWRKFLLNRPAKILEKIRNR